MATLINVLREFYIANSDAQNSAFVLNTVKELAQSIMQPSIS